MSTRLLAVWCLVLTMTVAMSAVAADMPGPRQSEWQLESVAGAPNAAAVVLERTGYMYVDEQARSSYLDVYVRLKVLTEEGVDYGSISLVSSDFYRTKQIRGRTHVPGGRVANLPDDATFEKEYSDYFDTTLVSSALPEVVPGAIIEYAYRVYFDSVFYPVPWYFQDRVPVVESRVVFEIPHEIGMTPLVTRTVPSAEFEQDIKDTVRGTRATFTMRHLPAVPDEPMRFPFADLASRVRLLPKVAFWSGRRVRLFEDWGSVAELAQGSREWGYTKFRSNSKATKSQGKKLAGSGTERERAEQIYRWVRDEVDLKEGTGIWTGETESDAVLENRKGNATEQAMLLHLMLDAAKIDSSIGWTCPRQNGRIRLDIPDPSQMDWVVCVVELDGTRYFLDPTDRSLTFGALQPGLQGVPCLVVKGRKHEWTTTPQLEADESVRTARLEIAVDDAGVATAVGSLEMTGNHGWRRLQWRNNEADTRDAWSDWIQGNFPGFDLDSIEVTERVETSRATVEWSVSAREDEVLGDEISILPSVPLAVDANPFTLAPNRRLTPVQLSFPDTDRIETVVTWPEGWVLEAVPEDFSVETAAGRYTRTVAVDAAARRAVLARELVIATTEFMGGAEYAALRNLYLTALEGDGQELLLMRE